MAIDDLLGEPLVKLTRADITALIKCVHLTQSGFFGAGWSDDPAKLVHVGRSISYFRWWRLVEAGLALVNPPRLTPEAVAAAKRELAELELRRKDAEIEARSGEAHN